MQGKIITCCADCAYYNPKKHKCTYGCDVEGNAQDHFYKDCKLDDLETHTSNVKSQFVSNTLLNIVDLMADLNETEILAHSFNIDSWLTIWKRELIKRIEEAKHE